MRERNSRNELIALEFVQNKNAEETNAEQETAVKRRISPAVLSVEDLSD